MLVSKAARRYAKALLELAEENNSVEKTLEDIKFIKNTLEDSRELVLFLKSPIVKPANKAGALEAIFTGKISEQVHKFIILIANKSREHLLDEITQAFIQQYNRFAGIQTVEVLTAHELDDQLIAEITKSLEKYTNKNVVLNLKVNPDLKGGIAVKINDTVIDGTVKHKLEQLQEKFLQSAAV